MMKCSIPLVIAAAMMVWNPLLVYGSTTTTTTTTRHRMTATTAGYVPGWTTTTTTTTTPTTTTLASGRTAPRHVVSGNHRRWPIRSQCPITTMECGWNDKDTMRSASTRMFLSTGSHVHPSTGSTHSRRSLSSLSAMNVISGDEMTWIGIISTIMAMGAIYTNSNPEVVDMMRGTTMEVIESHEIPTAKPLLDEPVVEKPKLATATATTLKPLEPVVESPVIKVSPQTKKTETPPPPVVVKTVDHVVETTSVPTITITKKPKTSKRLFVLKVAKKIVAPWRSWQNL